MITLKDSNADGRRRGLRMSITGLESELVGTNVADLRRINERGQRTA